MVEFQEQTGHLYNLEATPAEGTTYRFAREDRKRFPGILQAGTPRRPTTPTARSCRSASPTMPSRRWNTRRTCNASTPAAPCCTSTCPSRSPAPRPASAWCSRALGRFRLPYITITPTFSICPSHGYIAGEHEFCPRCDAVAAQGFRVGLHTAGAYPDRLARVLPGVDWIGLDIKALPEDYPATTGVPGSGGRAWRSLELVRDSGVPFDVRITRHPALLPDERLARLRARLAEHGITAPRLQACNHETMRDPALG
jgi:hypothetical protein